MHLSLTTRAPGSSNCGKSCVGVYVYSGKSLHCHAGQSSYRPWVWEGHFIAGMESQSCSSPVVAALKSPKTQRDWLLTSKSGPSCCELGLS